MFSNLKLFVCSQSICRLLCTSELKIFIPFEELVISYSRSSGPGGQNVNKVNTKAEVRFTVSQALWIPEDVRGRILENEKGRINSVGELVISSQEHRTQLGNKKECIKKLERILEFNAIKPKERIISMEMNDVEKDKRIKERKSRSSIKQNRRSFDFD